MERKPGRGHPVSGACFMGRVRARGAPQQGAISSNAVSGLEFGQFPEGDPASSPGLLYSATLGKAASELLKPNGVVALPGVPIGISISPIVLDY